MSRSKRLLELAKLVGRNDCDIISNDGSKYENEEESLSDFSPDVSNYSDEMSSSSRESSENESNDDDITLARLKEVSLARLKEVSIQRHNEGTIGDRDEFLKSLSETEKILTQNYKKINTCGKGSRTVPVLIPKDKLEYYDMILNIRKTANWFNEKNVYFFTYPKSNRWIDGTAVIRKYAKKCGAKEPNLITSSRLRKHIATVTQVLALKNNEIDQLARFMGHTTRTHEEFYKLPQDIYQTAKVSKILQMMEKGNAADFKNKSLDEIDINLNGDLSEQEDGDTDEENERGLEENNTTTISGQNNAIEDSDVNEENEQGIEDSRSNQTFEQIDVAENTSNDEENERSDKSKRTQNPKQSRKKGQRKICNKKGKNAPGQRRRWAEAEKKLVKKAFANNIKNRLFLKKDHIMKFIENNPKTFGPDDYVRIRTLVVNEYNVKK